MKEFLKGKKVIHGHTPQTEAEIREKFDYPEKFPVLNIDNGCVYEKEGMNQLC